MTALDQQVTVLEGKLTRSLAEVQGKQQGQRQEVSREEVVRIVREVMPAQPDNQERGGQPGYNQT